MIQPFLNSFFHLESFNLRNLKQRNPDKSATFFCIRCSPVFFCPSLNPCWRGLGKIWMIRIKPEAHHLDWEPESRFKRTFSSQMVQVPGWELMPSSLLSSLCSNLCIKLKKTSDIHFDFPSQMCLILKPSLLVTLPHLAQTGITRFLPRGVKKINHHRNLKSQST